MVSSPGAEPKKETAVSASLISPLSSSVSETSAQIFLEWAPRENEQSIHEQHYNDKIHHKACLNAQKIGTALSETQIKTLPVMTTPGAPVEYSIEAAKWADTRLIFPIRLSKGDEGIVQRGGEGEEGIKSIELNRTIGIKLRESHKASSNRNHQGVRAAAVPARTARCRRSIGSPDGREPARARKTAPSRRYASIRGCGIVGCVGGFARPGERVLGF